MTYLLAGDVGGTKTDLAVYSAEQGPDQPLAEMTLPSGRYPNLEALLRDFLDRVRLPIDRASFGVAGPVVNGTAEVTNLKWKPNEQELAEKLGLKSVRLLNDLVATAHSVPYLKPGDLHTLNRGMPVPGGALAVIAPGTGLGEAFLTWDGERYRAHPSEGGHTDFAPRNEIELELLRYLSARFDHVSYEWVCSGIGMPNLYAFLKERSGYEEPAWLTEQLASAKDPTPVIVRAALDHQQHSQLCAAVLDLFVSILGAEAGNLALKVLATGGVYIAGGIPPRILPVLERPELMQAFRQKGRFHETLSEVPVHVILKSQAALFGAACHGLEQGSF